jgi:hypothetical protein
MTFGACTKCHSSPTGEGVHEEQKDRRAKCDLNTCFSNFTWHNYIPQNNTQHEGLSCDTLPLC